MDFSVKHLHRFSKRHCDTLCVNTALPYNYRFVSFSPRSLLAITFQHLSQSLAYCNFIYLHTTNDSNVHGFLKNKKVLNSKKISSTFTNSPFVEGNLSRVYIVYMQNTLQITESKTCSKGPPLGQCEIQYFDLLLLCT